MTMHGALLARGSFVVTAADSPIRHDAAVVVEDGRVADVLDWQTAQSRYPDAEVIGSQRMAVLPGLINAHHHSHAVTWILHGLREQPFEPYLLGLSAVRRYDRQLDALICGARLLSTGVTSAVDLFSGGGTADRFAADINALRRGYAGAGLRVAVAAGMSTQSFLIYGAGEDQRFIEKLPADLRPLAAKLIPEPGLSEDDYFDVMSDIAASAAGDERFSLWFGVPGPEWVSDAFLQRIVERAKSAGTNVQTHAVETLPAKLYAHRTFGTSPVGRLDELGVLFPGFSIAHGVWLDEREIAILARSRASVSHNPGSNLRWFAGIAPVEAMRAAGVNVALGMDGSTLHDDEDMFSEMRLALRLNRQAKMGAPAMQPRDVFGMATLAGARLTGSEHRLGRLDKGYEADIVIVKRDRYEAPWVAPESDPLEMLLFRASRRDVDTVLVGGEVVYRGGEPTRFDLKAAMQELAAQVSGAVLPAEAAEAARRLAPHVERWYRDWPTGTFDPFTHYNSRT